MCIDLQQFDCRKVTLCGSKDIQNPITKLLAVVHHYWLLYIITKLLAVVYHYKITKLLAIIYQVTDSVIEFIIVPVPMYVILFT